MIARLLIDTEKRSRNSPCSFKKMHFNVMRFKNIFELDEAEVFAGRFKSVSARRYVLNDPEKLSVKYISTWQNFGLNSF
jgi:hypothetical protein